MIIEVTDYHTPMLTAIRQVSREVAFEVMSKVGNKIRKRAKKRISYTRHHWLQRPNKKGKLTPYYSKNKTKVTGQRTKPDGTEDNPENMGSMISSFLMEKSGVLLVGGRNRAFTPVKRKDGEIVGVEERQPTITAHTQSIIHKLDTGERNKAHGWGSGGNKKESMPGFKNANYVGRGFMKSAFRDSTPYMVQQLTDAYTTITGRAVGKVKVNIKPSKRKIS